MHRSENKKIGLLSTRSAHRVLYHPVLSLFQNKHRDMPATGLSASVEHFERPQAWPNTFFSLRSDPRKLFNQLSSQPCGSDSCLPFPAFWSESTRLAHPFQAPGSPLMTGYLFWDWMEVHSCSQCFCFTFPVLVKDIQFARLLKSSVVTNFWNWMLRAYTVVFTDFSLFRFC